MSRIPKELVGTWYVYYSPKYHSIGICRSNVVITSSCRKALTYWTSVNTPLDKSEEIKFTGDITGKPELDGKIFENVTIIFPPVEDLKKFDETQESTEVYITSDGNYYIVN